MSDEPSYLTAGEVAKRLQIGRGPVNTLRLRGKLSPAAWVHGLPPRPEVATPVFDPEDVSALKVEREGK